MICFPNAKINLGLNIVSKRPDGYHNIETVFYPVPLSDALEIVPADTFSFHQSGIAIHCNDEDNLVVRAFRLMEKKYSLSPVEIHLLKAIPSGAGLGGGSSDAAYMLKLVNDHFGLQVTPDKLENLAVLLGADCPFFIRNKPVFATGTGNCFEPVNLILEGWYLCLVKPDIHVSTPAAYGMVTPATPAISLKEIICRPVAKWKEVMVNDFERPVFNLHPEIGAIKEALYDKGAVYASMSGSGSSVFGLFREPADCKASFPGCYVWEGILE